MNQNKDWYELLERITNAFGYSYVSQMVSKQGSVFLISIHKPEITTTDSIIAVWRVKPFPFGTIGRLFQYS